MPTFTHLLPISPNGYVDQYGAQHIVGWVTNHSSQTLTSLVVAGFYNQAGIALDASSSNLAIPLKAGEAIPFNVTTFGNVDNNPAQAAQVRTFTAQVDPGIPPCQITNLLNLQRVGKRYKKMGQPGQ